MKIIKSEETLILTQIEKIILTKARNILDEIFKACEKDGEIETYSNEAMNNIYYLLEEAEVEDGEPKGEITISVLM
jgi:hypothetical protein